MNQNARGKTQAAETGFCFDFAEQVDFRPMIYANDTKLASKECDLTVFQFFSWVGHFLE